MTLSRIVFHCTDQDLFDLSIRCLPRHVLVQPLRNDQDLRARHFRGYHISKSSPDAAAISRAYYKEINTERNTEFMSYLCSKWIMVHEELATRTLECLGVTNVDLGRDQKWLAQAHDSLESKGHLDAAAEVVRALALDYPVEDILTILSILSADCEEQSELRLCIEGEFRKVHDDPGHLRSALAKQQTHLMGRLDDIKRRRTDEDTRCDAELSPIENELTRLAKRREKLKRERGEREKVLKKSREELEKGKKQLEDAQKRHNEANGLMQECKAKQTKLERSVGTAQQKLRERKYTRDALITDLDKEQNLVETELADIAERLEAAERRAQSSTVESAAIDSTEEIQHEPAKIASYDLRDVLAFVDQPGFQPSPVTLHILGLSLQGKLPAADAPPRREIDCAAQPEASAAYYAHMAVHGKQPWAGEVLGNYALATSLHHSAADMGDSGSSVELILGGLYHAERLDDSALWDQLLARLIDLVVDGESRDAGEYLSESIDALRGRVTDARTLRQLGAVQTKLATANSRALQRLYDEMDPGIRAHAKRALVAQVREAGLSDTDPTHEVLDVVTTYLESLLGKLTSGRHTWGEQATLRSDVQQGRQLLLASTAKLAHVFSTATNNKLTQFRDLLGHHLTQVLGNDTLDGYEVFRRMVLDYCQRDCYQPEWISARYLFPIVASLGHVASRADRAMRQRKAEVRVALEKQQHPLNAIRRGVPVRIVLENTGVATATSVQLEIEADKQDVSIRPRDCRVQKIGPEQRVWHEAFMDIAKPVSAVELSCLFHWKDPSGAQQFGEATLKLTAQREVNWSEARRNPYSLGSITSQERLVGRDGDLEALRIGIEGTQSFCITGQKRVGKTSVARVLSREFQDSDTHVAVYLTFGDLVASTWRALVYSLYEAISDEVEDVVQDGRVELPSADEFVGNHARSSRVFLRDLERKLGGRRVLCIIDDFDEIDERMYKGEESKDLFLRFRTLIDRGNMSFVLVGSEKLPDVLRHQGERLNQVQQRSLNYFRDRSSLERLVADPAMPYLEYSDEAIDEIWRYSAGNPYYATQICARVYGDMVGRRDHYVGASDVQRSVEEICRDAGVSTFQHLWTDGIFEGGLDTARLQYLNAAILAVCARCCVGREEEGLERGTLLGDASLGSYDPAQVRFRLDNLVDRGVLLQVEGRVRLRVPLFERWLLGGGEAAVRSSFSEEDLEVRLAPRMSGPGPRRIVEVTRDLHYQGRPMTEDRVRAWLEQFGPRENQDVALLLLERLKEQGYYDQAAVHSKCKALHRMMLQEFASGGEFAKVVERRKIRNVFVTHFEGEGRSGGRLLHDYRIANALAGSLVGSIDEAAMFVAEQQKRGREFGVVFVDDFIGTGGSCVEGLSKFRKKLRGEQSGHNKMVVGVAAIVGFKTGIETVRKSGLVDCHVTTTDEFGIEGRAFAPEANVFDTEEERLAAEALCKNIGEVLEPKQPLGFGDSQALVCFHYRCPNNTLPVFYKSGAVYQGRE